MKLELKWIDGEKVPVISEVYSGAFLEQRGNRVGFCMRDDTIELNVLPREGGSRWFRIDMDTLDVRPMIDGKEAGKQIRRAQTRQKDDE